MSIIRTCRLPLIKPLNAALTLHPLRVTWLDCYRFITLVLSLGFPFGAAAAVFALTFTGPLLDAGLTVSGSIGTSYSVGGGTLMLDQDAGNGDGLISVSTASPITGDFVATVTASGVGLGRADLGIHLGFSDFSGSLADVFLNDNSNTVNGNIFQPSFSGDFSLKDTDTVTLTITRQGDTITDLYNVGAGPIVSNSGTDPALAADMTLNLFLLNAVADPGAHQGAFTDLQIATGADATTILPEPTTLAMLGTFALMLCSQPSSSGGATERNPTILIIRYKHGLQFN